MKSLFEIKETINKIQSVSRINPYAPVEIQALEWAFKQIENEGLSKGQILIERRIFKLKYRQEKREVMSYATRPARAKQINALKWVVDEDDLKGVVGPV